MELRMIQSLTRNLAGHKGEELRVGVDYTAWQAAKLRELTRYRIQNRQMVTGCTNDIYRQLGPVLLEEFRQGIIGERARAEALGREIAFFTTDDKKVSALIDELKNALRAANSAALRKCNDVYRQVIFNTAMFAANGVMTERQAYDAAVKDFLERGIDCITYKDGRKVNIADYAGMSVRTASLRAHLMGEGQFRQALGEHLIIITKHNTACPLCQPWERKILVDDVYSGGTPGEAPYPTLSEAMDAGLYHPRCRHGNGTYYPELGEALQELEQEAGQPLGLAHAENQVHRYRRLVAGTLDPKTKAKYQAKLERWEKTLAEEQQKGLTQGVGNATISSPERFFANNLQKNGVSDAAYADALRQRFEQGTPEARRTYEKYVPLDSVANGASTTGIYYNPSDRRVYMNYGKDAQNSRGAGVTYFHEHGHLIDHSASNRMSSDAMFTKALRDDFKALLKRVKTQNGLTSQKDAYAYISRDVYAKNQSHSDAYSSVSDVLGGLSTTKSGGTGIRAGWGHHPSYWLRTQNKVEIEAFAHLYEAQYNAERLKAFQEYFPTATVEFDRIMKGVI